jgi:hypothetical protein
MWVTHPKSVPKGQRPRKPKKVERHKKMNAYCISKTLEYHNPTNNLRCNCSIEHTNKNEIRSLTDTQNDFFQVVIWKASSNKPFEWHNHLPKMISVKDGLLIRHILDDYYYDKSCHKVDSIKNENENDMHLDANGNDSIRWESVGFDLQGKVGKDGLD